MEFTLKSKEIRGIKSVAREISERTYMVALKAVKVSVTDAEFFSLC